MPKENLFGYAPEKPFVFTTYNNEFRFEAARCDFVGGVTVFCPPEVSPGQCKAKNLPDMLQRLMRAASEFTDYHTREVKPFINGFAGYDAIEYRYAAKQD